MRRSGQGVIDLGRAEHRCRQVPVTRIRGEDATAETLVNSLIRSDELPGMGRIGSDDRPRHIQAGAGLVWPLGRHAELSWATPPHGADRLEVDGPVTSQPTVPCSTRKRCVHLR